MISCAMFDALREITIGVRFKVMYWFKYMNLNDYFSASLGLNEAECQ